MHMYMGLLLEDLAKNIEKEEVIRKERKPNNLFMKGTPMQKPTLSGKGSPGIEPGVLRLIGSSHYLYASCPPINYSVKSVME